MSQSLRTNPPKQGAEAGRPIAVIWILLGCVAVVLAVLLIPRHQGSVTEQGAAPSKASGAAEAVAPITDAMRDRNASRLLHSRNASDGSRPPEVVVHDKAVAFVQERRKIAEAMSQKFGVQIPAEVQQFFDAAEGGKWDDIKGLYNMLSAQKESGGGSRDLDVLWPAIKEAYGVSQVTQSWPAKEILNYGESLLATLRPGMIYIAGSDAARLIPMFLSESGSGEGPVILPQSALAEGNQVDYLGFLHGNRLSTLTREDTQNALNTVVQNSQNGGRQEGQEQNAIQSALGQAMIAQLNERLIQTLMEKNPGASFAIEQSVPMTSLSANALAMGPILELSPAGAAAGGDAAVSARAAESLNYWRQTAERIQADSSLAPNAPTRGAFAQLAAEQAQYFAARNLPAEAEQAYRLGYAMAPASIEAVAQLSSFLQQSGKQADALQVIDEFGRQNEDLRPTANELRKSILAAPAAGQPKS